MQNLLIKSWSSVLEESRIIATMKNEIVSVPMGESRDERYYFQNGVRKVLVYMSEANKYLWIHFIFCAFSILLTSIMHKPPSAFSAISVFLFILCVFDFHMKL